MLNEELRLQAELSAARRSEEALRRILESMPDAYLRADLAGRLVLVSQSAARLFGFPSVDEMVGTPAVSLYATEGARQAMLELLRANGRVSDFVTRGRRTDGSEFWLSLGVQFIRDADGVAVGTEGFARDITERKHAEDALAASQRRLQSIIDASPVPIVMNDEGGRVTFLNPEFTKTFGYSADDLRTLEDWWPRAYPDPEYRERTAAAWQDELERARRTGTPFTPQEVHVRCKDGTRKTVLASATTLDGSPAGEHLVVLYDITDRKRDEMALQESEERYRRLFSEMNGGCALHAIVCDAEGRAVDYVTLDVNPGYERLLGIPRAAVIGQRASQLLPTNELRRWLDIFGPVAMQGTSARYELYSESKGKHFEGIAYRSGDGLFAVLFDDVTERKRAEEHRAALEAQLQQAQKMESVGRLAGGVAHDFNNMLSVILGNVDLAMAQVTPTQPIHNDLEEIRAAARRSAALTRQLLAFARKQIITPKVLDLNEAVEATLTLLRRLIGEDIELVWVPGQGSLPLEMDPSQIDQILANLCVNARDAIEGVGRITIQTSAVAFDERYCASHYGYVPGDYVRLSLSDNGCGMAKDTLHKVFDPFFTTKEPGKGTGLGLATVYGIVKQNRGFINVHSEPGQGTTFTLYLPRYAAQEQARTVPDEVAESDTRGHETILVVEDEPANLKLTTRILESLGYTVIAASGPSEAMTVVREHPGEIHLLLTDVIMPEMNGRDLARRVAPFRPDMACLFTSGYTADVIAPHGVLEAGIDFIQKPYSLDDLSRKLRDILSNR